MHVLSDAGFTHVDTQLEQLAVDTWSTPQRVLSVHPSDKRPNVCRNGWSAHTAAPRLPRPEHPETDAMPGNDGVRLDDHQRRSPSRPDPREPYPEEPVRQCQPRSLHGPLQDAQLVTECQDVKLQSRAAAEHQDNGREEGGEYAPGRQSMEEAQVIVYQSDLDLREPQGPILTRYTCGCRRRGISRLTERGTPGYIR